MATKTPQHLTVAADPERYARKLRYNRASAKRLRAACLAKESRRDPQRVRARKFILNLVHRGRLVRGACVLCGAPNAHAHHEDYAKKDEIIWLCRAHHAAVHAGTAQVPPGHIVRIPGARN